MNKKIILNEKEICDMYLQGKSLKKISDFLEHKSSGPTKKILLKNNIKIKKQGSGNNRKINLNENYFDEINTENKAYVLGWLISDGYVNNYKLTFCIKDLEILELIKKELNSEHKIIDNNYFDKRTNKTYQRYILQITSKKIIDSLYKLGIKQKKSFNCPFPIIKNKFIPDLIRGIFDGDGYIGFINKNNKPYPRLSITINFEICNEIRNILFKMNIIIPKFSIVSKKNKESVCKLEINGFKRINIFKNFIYHKESCIKLNRKYEIFSKI